MISEPGTRHHRFKIKILGVKQILVWKERVSIIDPFHLQAVEVRATRPAGVECWWD
jgi:hypothetical protein